MQLPENLPTQIAREIRARIDTGLLPAGRRINEVHLARELSVSRTPLREALTRLAGESMVTITPRHGFSVPPLTVNEVHELYPIRAQLDPWALRLSGLPGLMIQRDLEGLNRLMGQGASDPALAVELDDRFHLLLIDRCPNRTLVAMIRQMMAKTRRYEHLYFSQRSHVADAVRTHKAILAKLRDDDLDGACALLRQNMETASPALIAAIEARS